MINEYFAVDILQEVCQRGETAKLAVESRKSKVESKKKGENVCPHPF